MSWISTAERVLDDGSGIFLIGEDHNGLLCAPTKERFADGHRIWKPCLRVSIGRLLSSWLQRKIVFIEPSAQAQS